MIRFKNTLTGTVDEFKPLDQKTVGMYNCGPTVYGKVHVGNLRAYVFADLVRNVLQYNGYLVNQVINITDVGHLVDDGDDGADKIEEQARREQRNAVEVTRAYTDYFMNALRQLGIDTSAVQFPKASEHIAEQIDMIRTLENKGYTYTIEDGVYFDTSKYPAYGELGHIDIKGLREGARVERNAEKRSVTDFALWKFSKEKRQQEWESPWGVGFPGWHIECSAMAQKYLGKTFDIHTGGVDHIPTHHNNEIAQSAGANEVPLANYWLHVNHITIDGQKISKSIGNTVYIEDLGAQGISPLAYKYWLYTSHYSTLSNFTIESVTAAGKALRSVYAFLAEQKEIGKVDAGYREKFTALINDDLDTPKAIALVWELLKDGLVSPADKKATLLDFDTVFQLGFKSVEPHIETSIEIPAEVARLAEQRQEARLEKNFDLADSLREKIEELGYTVKDTDMGVVLALKE